MAITTDPNDPRLAPYRSKGRDDEPVPQQAVYLALPAEEIAKGYVKPYRDTYRHTACGSTTTMPAATAQTYARDPWFYGGTYCVRCGMHRDLDEFTWLDGEPMSPHQWPHDEITRIAKLRASRVAALTEDQLDLPLG